MLKGQKSSQDEPESQQISFYKLPSLYYEYTRRRNANSLKVFLEYVPESSYYFTAAKMESIEDFSRTSVLLT